MAFMSACLLALVAGAALAEPCADGQCPAQDEGDDVVSALALSSNRSRSGGECCYNPNARCSWCNPPSHMCSQSASACKACNGRYDTGCSAPSPAPTPAASCSVGQNVPCYESANSQTCMGDQCCNNNAGSGTVTCPSASVEHVTGCTYGKVYDCTR